MTGRLVLAATPLGNPADASSRLRHLLASADVIAAEDTRRVRRLAADLEVSIRGSIVSHFDQNEEARLPELVSAIRDGKEVLVVTDAGMPGVSDPGFRLVAACVAADLPVTCAPGPSAPTVALALSGLPMDRWCFEGFLPRKSGPRARALRELAGERRTMVFFEAPHRTAETLEAMADAFGAERPAALCRELTKTYEEVMRGTLAELRARVEARVKGEVTLVVSGGEPEAPEVTELVGEVHALVEAGARSSEAIAVVARQHGVSRKDLYAEYHRGSR